MSTHLTWAPNLAAGLALGLAACGGAGSPGQPPDDSIPCPSGSCGKASFRSAVPGRRSVQIDFDGGRRRQAAATERTRLGIRPAALEAVAPGYLALGDHVDEINGAIDDIFADLEALAGDPPEIEEATVHQWRRADPDAPDLDEVLLIQSDDELAFTLAYAVGPAGFEPTGADVVITGEVHLDGDGGKEDFALVVDFDQATAVFPELDLTGRLELRAQPFSGGAREVWYDFVDFGAAGGPLETSLTTYWIFGDGDGALEYLDSLHDSDATLFARWDGDGGRLDYHVAWFHDQLGELDEISTDCWDGGGPESFYGWALIDELGQYYVEMDGDEAACQFGPVDGHPDPGSVFDGLPGDGEWDDLAELSAPLCEDEPDDPDCIESCDLFPEDC